MWDDIPFFQATVTKNRAVERFIKILDGLPDRGGKPEWEDGNEES